MDFLHQVIYLAANRAEATGSSPFSIDGEVIELKLPVALVEDHMLLAANKLPKVYKNARIEPREEKQHLLSIQEHANISSCIYFTHTLYMYIYIYIN